MTYSFQVKKSIIQNPITRVIEVTFYINWNPDCFESTIMLRESSQGESSVMRVRLEGHKKTH